jgi:hypothetical protein
MQEIHYDNGIIKQWISEAKREVADHGWKDASVNALLLLTHDMSRHQDEQIMKMLVGPVKFFMGILATGIIWWIIRDFILRIPA